MPLCLAPRYDLFQLARRLGQSFANPSRMRAQSPLMPVWAGRLGGIIGAVGSSASDPLIPISREYNISIAVPSFSWLLHAMMLWMKLPYLVFA